MFTGIRYRIYTPHGLIEKIFPKDGIKESELDSIFEEGTMISVAAVAAFSDGPWLEIKSVSQDFVSKKKEEK